MGPRTKTPLSQVKPEAYPLLSREAVGGLKFIWRKANVDDDWGLGGAMSEAWDRVTGFPYWHKPTYDCDYSMRLVGLLAQELPAWREVTAQAADALVSRFPQHAAWYDWVEEKGLDSNKDRYPLFYYKHLIPPGFAGVYNAPGYCGNGFSSMTDEIFASIYVVPRRKPLATTPYYPKHDGCEVHTNTVDGPRNGRQYNPDPIYGNGSSNMMYKGYFAHSLMMAHIISGDQKYLEPQHLVYDDKIQYRYTCEQIIATMNEQHQGGLDENGSPLIYGIDCEVGKVFPVCVSVGGLAANMYDKLFGTYYRKGYDDWLVWAKDGVTGGADDPEGPFTWCAPYFDRDIPYAMKEPEQQMGAFFIYPALQIAPVDPGYALRIYEGMCRNYGVQEDDGWHLNWPKELTTPLVLEDRVAMAGAFAFAHEFNDVERLEGMRQWMEARYEPTFKDGEFYYTFGLEESWPRGIPNVWATMGHVGEAGAMRRMYNEPNMEKFGQPTVTGVDYPNLAIRQAYYDAEKDALVVGTTTGVGRTGSRTTFKVTNLDVNTEHEVLIDGSPSDNWSATSPGEIVVQTAIGDHTFVIR